MAVILACGYASALAYDNNFAGPHIDYTPKYGINCFGNNMGACHAYTSSAFMPETLGQDISKDWTGWCLSCHNATGEAHERKPGSPSTNAYSLSNRTTLVPGSYSGDSHSWTGNIGNAGSRVPTLTYMETNTHMPNGTKVTCQVCHQAMGKSREDEIDWATATDSGDHLHFTFGYSSTKQYLAKYMKVYRGTSKPTYRRDRKAYLVDPSEYTYDPSNGTITFLAAQAPLAQIAVEIAQPYFREGNLANRLCLDCHTDRTDGSVSHEPGSGAKDSHPVVTAYGHTVGLNDTLKSSPDSNIYIEGGQILCTSCHDPHNADSDDGQMTRSADSSDLCTDCHKANGFDGYTSAVVANHNGNKHSAATKCLDCHTTHGSNNILLIKNTINGKTINFRNFAGSNSFGNDNGSSVCEACHTATNYHKSDGTGTGHNTGLDCTSCHPHSTGFRPTVDCGGCHGYPPDVAPSKAGPSGWADTTGDAHHAHKIYLEGAAFGLSGNAVCEQCHGTPIPRGDHNTGKLTAGIDTGTWGNYAAIGGSWGTISFSDNGTDGKVNTGDDTCTNVSCHSSGGTRQWAGGGGCNSCHGFPPATAAHSVQYATGTTAHLVSAGDPIYDAYTTYGQTGWPCGKCHNNTIDKHKNLQVDLAPGGSLAACGPATEFTINQTTPGSDVTCTNVRCHTAGKTTPNWF